MIDEHDLVLCNRSEGDAYKSAHSAELSLNTAILRGDISNSYEEFLDIFETFYADDVEVSREGLREMIRGKEKVRPFLLNLLVPLHVMAEIGGLSAARLCGFWVKIKPVMKSSTYRTEMSIAGGNCGTNSPPSTICQSPSHLQCLPFPR